MAFAAGGLHNGRCTANSFFRRDLQDGQDKNPNVKIQSSNEIQNPNVKNLGIWRENIVENGQCYLCNKNLEQSPTKIFGNGIEVDCKVCGKYIRQGHAILDNLEEEKRCLLSGCIREINELGENESPPKIIDKKDMENIFSSVKIPVTMLEKAYKIIHYLGKKSKIFGQRIQIDYYSDYPIAYAHDAEEFVQLTSYLDECGYINGSGSPFSSLTMEGWQKFEELKSRQPDSKQCFVAMSFDKSLNDIYEQGIKKAIEDAGYDPIRIDKEEHNEKICDRIIAEIRKSRFIVADFTQQKQGVYFEAGFAKGLNIPVIWLCCKEEVDKKKLHFDTQQYNHIAWENSEDLHKQLYYRIKDTII